MLPTLHTILVDLLYAGAVAALGFVLKYLQTHTNSKTLQTLAGLASSAVPFIERAYGELGGAAKMAKAVAFVNAELTRLHIPLSAADIEAAIERAYAEAKASGVLDVYNSTTPAPAPAKSK